MADNTYRPFRSHDPIAGDDVDPRAGDMSRDPLAELARLIGQGSRTDEFDRGARHDGAVETLDHEAPAAGDQDWAAADRDYAAPREPERYADEAYVQPRLPEPYPSEHDEAGYDERHAPTQRYAEQEPADSYDDPHDDAAYRDERYVDDGRDNAASYQPRYADEEPRSVARQQAPLTSQAHDDDYETEGHWDDDTQADEDYEDETASPPPRRGIAFVAAVLGLVLVGASGAVAYRSMFGGAILTPALPPIIKAGDGPNKIVPKQADAQSGANQAGAGNPAAPEKLVSREEQPVAVQPPNAAPRVVSTIPVPPPGAAPAPPGVFPALGPNVLGAAPPSSAPIPAAPQPRAAAPGQPAAAAPATPGEPKRVHTVAIHPDQPGSGDAATAAPPTAPASSAPRARTPEAARPAPAQRGGNAPLSLVPGAPSSAAAAAPAEPPRRHEARTEGPPPSNAPAATAPAATAPAAAAPASGGYAVQVTSQRSEGEAQSAFQALQRKFPGQLGNKAPIIHRADLGDKGTYYRAMVGPYPSSEAAASFCSSLKAAGGSCLVQRN